MHKMFKYSLLTIMISATLTLTSCSLIPALRPNPSDSLQTPSLPETPQTPAEIAAASAKNALETLVKDGNNPNRQQIIATLIAANFNSDNFQVTADRTPVVGNKPESIDVGILYQGQCLVGSVSAGAVTMFVTEIIESTGLCLIGETPPN